MIRLLSTFSALTIMMSSLSVYAASERPINIYGNLGYFFTYSEADEGAKGNSTLTTFSLNGDSYLWRPWFATLNVGGTASMISTETAVQSSEVDLLETHLDFSLIPRSRFPFRLSYNTSNRIADWGDWNSLPSFGQQYRSTFLNMRQSYIADSGDRYDGWFTHKTREYFGSKFTDDTFGAKARTRGKNQNLYANATYQERKNENTNQVSKSAQAAVTHNYFPTKDFYIKTLVSDTIFKDGSGSETSNIFGDRTTNTAQLSSFFYWRPEYRPYNMTGGLRSYVRDADLDTANSDRQISVDANLAGTYRINRRINLTASANGSALHSRNETDAQNFNQSVLLSYRSDKVFYRDLTYHWYANTGIGNKINAEFEEVRFSQNLNGSIGHNAQRSWVTGNRSRLRVSLTQSAREVVSRKPVDSSFSVSHSATLNWNEEMKRGQFYTQLTMLDNRNFDNDTETQILHYQFSRLMPINRLSEWGAHLSVQSSRVYDAGSAEDSFLDGFLTTSNGRLNYQHARMFGIYKLKFRVKGDLSSTESRDGGARVQADLEARLGYNIGKLSTALIGRKVWSDTGLGTWVTIFQLNRSF